MFVTHVRCLHIACIFPFWLAAVLIGWFRHNLPPPLSPPLPRLVFEALLALSAYTDLFCFYSSCICGRVSEGLILMDSVWDSYSFVLLPRPRSRSTISVSTLLSALRLFFHSISVFSCSAYVTMTSGSDLSAELLSLLCLISIELIVKS